MENFCNGRWPAGSGDEWITQIMILPPQQDREFQLYSFEFVRLPTGDATFDEDDCRTAAGRSVHRRRRGRTDPVLDVRLSMEGGGVKANAPVGANILIDLHHIAALLQVKLSGASRQKASGRKRRESPCLQRSLMSELKWPHLAMWLKLKMPP